MRHIIRDEILNFIFFVLNYYKRAKMSGNYILCMEALFMKV